MVVFLEYVSLGGDPWANISINGTLVLGCTLKTMVILGSDTLKVVKAFVSFSSTTALSGTGAALARGMKICSNEWKNVNIIQIEFQTFWICIQNVLLLLLLLVFFLSLFCIIPPIQVELHLEECVSRPNPKGSTNTAISQFNVTEVSFP